MSVTTHPLPSGDWIAQSDGLWLPGVYDSQETAQHAATLSRACLHALGRIYRNDGEGRALTMDDLDCAEAT